MNFKVRSPAPAEAPPLLGNARSNLPDCLTQLQVHPADDLVVDGVSDPLSSSCFSGGRVCDEEAGMHHRLKGRRDGRGGEAEGVRDLSAGRGSVFPEVSDDAGTDQVAKSLDGILQPLAPSSRADRGSPRHGTHCAVARRIRRRSSGCLDYSLR